MLVDALGILALDHVLLRGHALILEVKVGIINRFLFQGVASVL